MTIAGATSRDGQAITLAIGVTRGHFLLRHHDVTICGPKVGNAQAATLRPDGQFGTAFQVPWPLPTGDGQPVSSLTLRDLTVDGDSLTGLSSLVGGTAAAGPRLIELHNVDLVNVSPATIALLNANRVRAHGVRILGDGGGVKSLLTSTETYLRGVSVRGGSWAFQDSHSTDDATIGTIPGIDIDGLEADLYLTQSPRFEAVSVTAIDDGGITASHVLADRSHYDTIRIATPVCSYDPQRTLRDQRVRKGDRIETADRRWSRVTDQDQIDDWHAAGSMRIVSAPSEEATVYRLTFGRVFHWTATRILLQHPSGVPVPARWHSATGVPMPTPELVPGTIVDVIRHGLNGAPRDYDVGAIHVTRSARDARVRNVTTADTGSDSQSYRGPGTKVTSCFARLSRDMCFTLDAAEGDVTLERCQAEAAGMHGFWLGATHRDDGRISGKLRLLASTATGCGSYGYGHGVYVEPEMADRSEVQVRGSGHSLGDSNRPELVKPWVAARSQFRAVQAVRDWRFRR